jgi:cell division protein FtsA
LPAQVQGLSDVVRNPIFSTGVGLLLYARDNAMPVRNRRSIGNAKTVIDRMRSWFQGNF